MTTPFENQVAAAQAVQRARAAVQRARQDLADRKAAVADAETTLEVALETLAEDWAAYKRAEAAIHRTA